MIFVTCIKCRNQDFERPDKGDYLVSRKVEVLNIVKIDIYLVKANLLNECL